MSKILSRRFFNRPALKVAEELLGKFLVRRLGSKTVALMITETEAYDGSKDKASHASRGRTERNKIMFGQAGHWYVYFTYGMHWMLNVVTGPKDYPAAVLIRAAIFSPSEHSNILKNIGMREINGPARITKFLKIGKKFNGRPSSKKTGLWIAAPTKSERASLQRSGKIKIKRAPRVGVDYAGRWAAKPYRFILKTGR